MDVVLRVAPTLPLLVACRAACEPTISGGTPEDRLRVAERVDTFLALLGPDLEVCVPEVTVTELPPDRAGDYSRYSRRIRLESLATDTIFHELCHAVDFQNGVETTPYRVSPDTTWAYALREESESAQVFADACALGPGVAQLATDVCPQDPPGMWVYRDVADLFVGGDPEQVDLETEVAFVRTVVRPTAATTLTVWTVEGAGVLVDLDGERWALDPSTGDEVVTDAPGELVATFAATEDEELGWRSFETLDGALGYRRYLRRDERAIPLGCWSDAERAFSWEGRLWTARLADGALEIGYWRAG